MATWTDFDKRIWTFDDGKLDFDAWIQDDAARQQRWNDAAKIHSEWRSANPDADPSSFACDAGKIFGDWIDYANASTT